MTNEQASLEKYTSHFIRNGCERVMCERWVGDWTKTATYWPPVPPSLAALLSRSARLLNWGHWGPGPLLRAGSHCLEMQQLTPNSLNFLSHRVISLCDIHLLICTQFNPSIVKVIPWHLWPDAPVPWSTAGSICYILGMTQNSNLLRWKGEVVLHWHYC